MCNNTNAEYLITHSFMYSFGKFLWSYLHIKLNLLIVFVMRLAFFLNWIFFFIYYFILYSNIILVIFIMGAN